MASSSSTDPSTLDKLMQLIQASLRPLPPRFGDGQYNTDVNPPPVKTGIVTDLASQAGRIPQDIDLIYDLLYTLVKGGYLDDSKYIMEKIIAGVASLPTTSTIEQKLTSTLTSSLWQTLYHPPVTYLGTQSVFRTADGSNNNILYPDLGKSNTPYAKSVKPVQPQYGALPDPGVLFDALLARKEYKKHPARISSMLFYMATIIIHDLFVTGQPDYNINTATSYLDLGPLYGTTQEEQNAVRTLKDGLLKPDTFSSARILGFPPGVSVLLICFNRFHNYIATQLALINEGGRFSPPDAKSLEKIARAQAPKASDHQIAATVKKLIDQALITRDDNLFQTARLSFPFVKYTNSRVTCGLYINIILYDYVRVILGLNRTNDPWILDPRANGPDIYAPDGTPSGVGNQVSCEFNLIYRWHAAISERDDKWTQEFAQATFPGKDFSHLPLDEFIALLVAWNASIPKDPAQRQLDRGLLIRDPNTGMFDDSALIQILTESTQDCAAAFDSGVPLILRMVEVAGIYQSRQWHTATLNEFRNFFGLVQHAKFEDINSDKEIALKLRQFYDHPDNVEMYPGVVIENPKVPMYPGSGLCPPQTIGRAILSDAVALVRGDRYNTQSYSPANLTNFGFEAVASDPTVAQGCVIYRLLMRAFPGWYEDNTIYAMYPFVVPEETEKILKELKTASKYSFKPPSLPQQPIFFSTYANAKTILGDQKTFKVPWGTAINTLTGGVLFMLSGDKPANHAQHVTVYKALYNEVPDGMDEVWDFYSKRTEKLLKERSYKLDNFYQVDAVRDIINMVHVEFTSLLFNLPLKTEKYPRLPFTEQQMYEILALLFGFVFLNRDEVMAYKVRSGAEQASSALGELVKLNVNEVALGGWVKKLADNVTEHPFLSSYGNNFIRRLLDAGYSADQITWIIMPTAAAGCANQGQQSIQMLDVYLSKDYSHHWDEIVRLAHLDDPHSRKLLRAYALEGCRLSTQAFGLFRNVAEPISIEENGKTTNLKVGEQIFVNLVGANLDPVAFPDPLEVKLDRPESSYILYGWGPHHCIGEEINIVANTAILRAFARLPKLRRAPGPQGELKYVIQQEVVKVFMQEDWGSYWFFPTTMKVHYDAVSPPVANDK